MLLITKGIQKPFESFQYSYAFICYEHQFTIWHLLQHFKLLNGYFSIVCLNLEKTCILLESPFRAELMTFAPTPYIKVRVSISYDCIINFNALENAYKANILLLLLSSLATGNYQQYSIDNTTEQSFRHTELTDAKILIF